MLIVLKRATIQRKIKGWCNTETIEKNCCFATLPSSAGPCVVITLLFSFYYVIQNKITITNNRFFCRLYQSNYKNKNL